jgi:hypothetical protein
VSESSSDRGHSFDSWTIGLRKTLRIYPVKEVRGETQILEVAVVVDEDSYRICVSCPLLPARPSMQLGVITP